jgi:hypothetical protein
VFFEIKFTEQGFAKAKINETHKTKFENTYQHMIREQTVCNPENIKDENFFNYYQLFRNAIRVMDKNKYVVFIFPKGNKKCDADFNAFKKEFINGQDKENIKCLYWEELITQQTHPKLYEKYFGNLSLKK